MYKAVGYIYINGEYAPFRLNGITCREELLNKFEELKIHHYLYVLIEEE